MVPYVTNNRAKTLTFRKLGNVWYFVVRMVLQPRTPVALSSLMINQY